MLFPTEAESRAAEAIEEKRRKKREEYEQEFTEKYENELKNVYSDYDGKITDRVYRTLLYMFRLFIKHLLSHDETHIRKSNFPRCDCHEVY